MSLFTKGQTYDFIEKVFGEGKPSNGGLNISVLCPNCAEKKGFGYNKKKLVIRTDTFVSHCWVCNSKSRNLVPWLKRWYPNHLGEYIGTFLKGQQLTDIDPDDLEDKEVHATLPEGYQFLLHADNEDSPKARRYLSSRGIFNERDYWYWKFGIAPNNEDLKDRIIIPSFDASGNVNYWTARSYNKKVYPKYINPPVPRESVIFNEINIDWSKPLTLVEGPFDLLKCNENATCLLGSSFGPEYVLFRKIVENETPVVLALDEDAKEKALVICRSLAEYGINVTTLNVTKQKGDVGAMTKEEFKALQKTGKAFSIESFLLEKIRLAFG
jgi:hypothetical protein